jgi:hypothetical protein
MCKVQSITKKQTELSPGEPAMELIITGANDQRLSDLVWIHDYWKGKIYPLVKSTWTEPSCRRRGLARRLVILLSNDYSMAVLVDRLSFPDNVSTQFWERLQAEGYVIIR